MTKNLVCVICPRGCALNVTTENGVAVSVQGNACKRGELYGKNEVTNPVRTLTTTIKTENGDAAACENCCARSQSKAV